ncbi:MAG: hypothetical protein ACRC6L_01855, partial [Steroidobacteraceae bacterium]
MQVKNDGIDGRRVRGVQGRLTVVCRAAVAVAGLAWAVAVQAAPPAVPGMDQIVTRTLSNGMKLVVWPDRDIPNVAMYTWYRV